MLVHQIINVQEIAKLKIKIHDILFPRKLISLLQKLIQKCHKPHKGKYHIAKRIIHIIILTLALQLKQYLIAPVQRFLNRAAVLLHDTLHSKKILLIYLCAVHLSASFDHIVCLINEKNIVSLYPLLKKSLKINIRVKHIVVIADNIITPARRIKTKLKWTNGIPIRLRQNIIALNHLTPAKQIKNRIIYSVKMPLCIWTVHRIALHLITQAQLLLCRNLNSFCPVTVFFKKCKRFLCYRCGNRLRCQVKDSVCQLLTNRLHCRKNSRDGLSDTCRSLHKKKLLSHDCPIDIRNKLFLPRSVLKREPQFFN